MEKSTQKKGADKKGQCNDRKTKISHDQFKFFTGNHSHSESFENDYNASLFFTEKIFMF